MNMISSVAAITAVAVPVAAPGVAAAEGNPDQQLMDLFAELKVAGAACDEANKLHENASEKFEALSPERPEQEKPPAEFAEMYETLTVREMEIIGAIQPKHGLFVWWQQQQGKTDVALDEWRKRTDALKLECGIAAAEEAADERYNEKMEIYDEMMEIPARTAAGLLLKLEAADFVYLSEDGGFVEHLRDDIKTLAAQAKAA